MTFDGDTAENIVNTNALGMQIAWHLATGPSDIHGASTTFGRTVNNSLYSGVTGQSNFLDNTNNEFYLTGVQLEVGDTATTFEHRSIGEELSRCKRYYYDMTTSNSAYSRLIIHQNGYFQHPQINHPVEMRVAPTITFSTVARRALNGGSDTTESISNTTSGKTNWTSYVSNTSNTFQTFIYYYPIKFNAEL